MMDAPYAYMAWVCSRCGNQPIERGDQLVCETDGLTFAPDSMTHATRVPDEEDREALAELEEKPCHRTREHPEHVEFQDMVPQFHCPGVGNFAVVVEPPADPFAGIEL